MVVLTIILEYNDDLNTLRLVEVFIQLIQDGIIEMNHLITLLQFVKKVPTLQLYNLNKLVKLFITEI